RLRRRRATLPASFIHPGRLDRDMIFFWVTVVPALALWSIPASTASATVRTTRNAPSVQLQRCVTRLVTTAETAPRTTEITALRRGPIRVTSSSRRRRGPTVSARRQEVAGW